MIMMMTDPDRVASSAFLPTAYISASFHSFHSPIHANFNAHLPLERPTAICHTSYFPDPRLPFHNAAKLFVFFSFLVNTAMPDPSITCHAFSLWSLRSTPQPIFFHFYCTSQPTTTQKACNQSHSALPSFFASPARVHAPTFDYLCIYYPWRYLSRTKKKDLVKEERHRRTKKRCS